MIQTPQLSISKRGLFSSLGILASALLLSGCQDEDYGYTADQIAYQTNFQKAYGKISEVPTWDLSSYNLKKMGLTGGPSNDFAAIGGAKTRAFSASASTIKKTPSVEWYKVQDATLTWLNQNLAEKVDHKGLGDAFTLINPFYDENKGAGDSWGEFLIIPIYQGATGMTWDLHLVDDQYDYTIWQKSQDFKYTIHHDKWEEFFFQDLSNKSISLKNAFQGVNTYTNVWVSFMPNAGTMGGRFFVTDNNYSTRAYITELDGNSFIHGNTEEQNAVSLNAILNKSYPRHDGKGSVTATLEKLYFEPSGEKISYDTDNPQKEDYVYATPYPAERLHVWVKFENPSPTQTTDKTLINFTQSGSALRPVGSSDRNVTYFEGHTINRSDVQSKVMRIDATKLGREFSLYLETKYSDQYNQSYSKEGIKHRSNGDPKMMLALHDFNAVINKPIDFEKTLTDLGITHDHAAGFEYMVIGCEDANGSNSDWDYNDVVLLFVGLPKVPKIATNVVQKRYMIEDLGSTFDFDFNDIVVDVTDENIVTIGSGETVHKQIVSIAHLCGTIPFDVHFLNQNGSTTSIFGKLMGNNNEDGTGGAGYDPKSDSDYINKYVKVYDANLPWRPNDNNIVVYVWPEAAGLTEATGDGNSSLYNAGSNNLLDIKKAQRIDFPKKGQFPYIIAVDQDINWMPELHSVPEAWFKTAHITERYPENDDNPSIDVPTKPNPTPDAAGYGDLIADSYMVNNADGTTTVKLGEFLTSRYLNPGRDLTFTVVLSSSCLPSSTNNHSTAVPEVKGEFALSGQTSAEKLYDAAVNLKEFKYPEGDNRDIIIQQFTLIDALTIDDIEDDANDQYLLSVANAQRLLFNINYATYGFKDAGTGNPQAKLYVKWDKRPALKLTFDDPGETGSFTVRQNDNNVQNTNGVYLVNANTEFTISGKQDCKYLWYNGTDKVAESTNTATSGAITINDTDTELKVKVYHAIVPELHNYIGDPVTEENRNLLDLDANYNGRITSSNDCKITLTWSAANGGDNSSSTTKLYVPVGAVVDVALTLTDSKYEHIGWKWGNKSQGTNKSFTITKANRETEYTPQAAIRDLSVKPTLSFTIADEDKAYIDKIYVNSQELTITDGAASTNVAVGETLNFKIVHKNSFGSYEVVYEVLTATPGYSDYFVQNNTEKQFKTMPSSGLTFTISAKYQVQAYINGAYNATNDHMGIVTITYGNNQTTEEKQVWLKTGSSYEFSAAPKTGYRFKGWENNPSLTGTVDHSRVLVNALFEEDSYHITVHASYERGTVKINSESAAKSVEGDYNSGSQLTLTATPNSGYYFVNWSLGSRYSQITHTVSAEKTIWANFAEGASIFDCGATPASLVGSEYPKLDNIKNDNSVDGAGQNFNALKTALNGKSSATLRIYCDNGSQSRTVHILRHAKNWGGIVEMTGDKNNDSDKYYNVPTSGDNQGIVDIPLTQEAITNLLNYSEGLVIQNNTDQTDVELKIIRVVVF